MTLTLSEQIKSHQNLQARQMRSIYTHLVARAAESKQVAKDAEVAADLLPRLGISLEQFDRDIYLRRSFVAAKASLAGIDHAAITTAKSVAEEKIRQHADDLQRMNDEMSAKARAIEGERDQAMSDFYKWESAYNAVASTRAAAGDLVGEAE